MTKLIKNVTYSDWYINAADKKPKLNIDQQYAAPAANGWLPSPDQIERIRLDMEAKDSPEMKASLKKDAEARRKAAAKTQDVEQLDE